MKFSHLTDIYEELEIRQLIFSKKLSFKNLVNLQKQVIGKGKKDEKACTPILPIKLAKNEQFYNDE